MYEWAYLFLIVSITACIIAYHVIWRNWEFIGLYRGPKILALTLVPSFTITLIFMSIEANRIFTNQESFLMDILVYQIFAIIIAIGLVVVFILLWIYFGAHWMMRNRFRFYRYFGPYLFYGKDPTTSMIICWGHGLRKITSDIQSNIHILIGTTPEHLESYQGEIQTNQRIFYQELQNLSPNTTYYYQIPTKKEIYHFTTAPKYESGKPCNFEFVAISDFHGSCAILTETIELIKSLPKVQFIISAGDIIGDARILVHWRTLWGQMKSISSYLPLENAAGNHDTGLSRHVKEYEMFMPYPYHNKELGFHHMFTYLNSAIFLLDCYNRGTEKRIPKPAQMEWLRQQLDALPVIIDHKILVLHNAIYTTGDFGCDPDLAALFVPIIEKYKIHMIFCGHSHIFEAFYQPDLNPPVGTEFIVTGGGGARCDYCLYHKISKTPYKWDGPVHIAKQQPFLRGDKKDRFRNDAFVLKNQEFGKLTHQITHIAIQDKKMIIRALEWGGAVLYERTLDLDESKK